MNEFPVETLTLVRHGFSEANFLQVQHDNNQEALKAGVEGASAAIEGVPPEFHQRHDSNMRLTELGIRQAKAAGEWLRLNHPSFDRFHVSPHNRTLETAHHMKLGGQWRIDDLFRERDWGLLATVTEEGLDPLTAELREAKKKSSWYWRPPEGETLASDVRLRMLAVMEILYREGGRSSNLVAVSHAEFLRVAQFVIEKLTPLQWEEMDNDPRYAMRNCMIFQYTIKDPVTGEREDRYKWRRVICPWDESLSWDNGEWVRFETKKYTDSELVGMYESHDLIFPPISDFPPKSIS